MLFFELLNLPNTRCSTSIILELLLFLDDTDPIKKF